MTAEKVIVFIVMTLLVSDSASTTSCLMEVNRKCGELQGEFLCEKITECVNGIDECSDEDKTAVISGVCQTDIHRGTGSDNNPANVGDSASPCLAEIDKKCGGLPGDEFLCEKMTECVNSIDGCSDEDKTAVISDVCRVEIEGTTSSDNNPANLREPVTPCPAEISEKCGGLQRDRFFCEKMTDCVNSIDGCSDEDKTAVISDVCREEIQGNTSSDNNPANAQEPANQCDTEVYKKCANVESDDELFCENLTKCLNSIDGCSDEDKTSIINDVCPAEMGGVTSSDNPADRFIASLACVITASLTALVM